MQQLAASLGGFHDPQSPFRLLPIADIDPDPDQPRQTFAQDLAAALADPQFQELVSNIRATRTVAVPIHVQPSGERWTLIAGERRLRAAREAGLSEIPAIISPDLSPVDRQVLALTENLFRVDLTFLEKADAFQRIAAEAGLSQREVAQKFGLTDAVMSKYFAVKKLPADILAAAKAGLVPDLETALALRSVPKEEREPLLARAAAAQLPVSRQTAERLRQRATQARTHPAAIPPPAPTPGPSPVLTLILPRRHLEALLLHHEEAAGELDDASLVQAVTDLLARLAPERQA